MHRDSDKASSPRLISQLPHRFEKLELPLSKLESQDYLFMTQLPENGVTGRVRWTEDGVTLCHAALNCLVRRILWTLVDGSRLPKKNKQDQ